MPLPHLHIFHPPDERLPGILGWLAVLEQRLTASHDWIECRFHRHSYGSQADFNVPTAAEQIKRALGPVILIEKVQYKLFMSLQRKLARDVSVYLLAVHCTDDLLCQCEAARVAFELGEPLVPLRELVAYLILKKLVRLDMWAGEAKNKDFLWSRNLPKGGFPKDCVDVGGVMEVATELIKVGLLVQKESKREIKYGLGPKSLVQPIIDGKSFAAFPEAPPIFRRERSEC